MKDTSTPMEMEDDDIIILDQEEEEQTNDTVGRPSVGKLLNISNENIITEHAPTEKKVEKTETKDEPAEEEEMAEPVDEDIQVLKTSIYKFHGTMTNDDDKLDTFTYQTYDDFEDDVVVLEDEEDSEEECEEEIQNHVMEEEQDPFLKCGECGEECKDDRKLDDHMDKAHPPRQSKLRSFGRIGFFMMST